MIINSVVFSLGEPKDNLYIQMFLLSYWSLLKHSVFNPKADQYILTCDKETAEYIQKTFPLIQQIKYLIVPKPKNCYDGMKLKYVLPFVYDVGKNPVLYIDVDVFAFRPFRLWCPEDSIVAHPEGSITDSNYCGDMDFKGYGSHGYTAGFFGYSWGQRVKGVFASIINDIENIPKKYYTLDQPYFNKYLKYVQVIPLSSTLSGNGHGNLDNCMFINCCGEPGDGAFHYNKMLQLYLKFH